MDKYTATEEAYKHGYEKGYEAGYKDGYENGFEDGLPKWISVSKRLPKYNTFVIVFAEGIVGEAVLDDADYWYWAGTDEYASEIKVTHWMPLPEPPKED